MVQRESRTRRFIEKTSFYYLLFVGFLSVRYDFQNRKIYHSKWRTIYVNCINIILIISMPITMYRANEFVGTFSSNVLVQTTDLIGTFILLIVVVVMILTRIQRENNCRGIFSKVFAIEERFFDKLPMKKDLQLAYDRMYLRKFIASLSLWIVSVFLTLALTPFIDLESVIMALYFSNVLYLLHGLMFHYYSAMWNASRNFEVLLLEVKKLVEKLQYLNKHRKIWLCQRRYTWRYFIRIATEELSEISSVHWKLTSLLQLMTHNFQWLILAVLLTYTIQTITFGYYAVLVLDGSLRLDMSAGSKYLGLVSYWAVYYDLYLFYHMCDRVTNAFSDMTMALKTITELPAMGTCIEKQCDTFHIQLIQGKLQINMGGMFALNLGTFLGMWAFIIQNTMFLVQSDYGQRNRQEAENTTMTMS